jgi:mono/diheme cytochrome c family protein
MSGVEAQHAPHRTDGSVRMTMEALHAAGGVPPGWKFTVPQGDPVSGREAFVTMQCYTCHTVQGETFPASPSRRDPGPDLTGMGAHHPAAYFAESIVNPNAVIVTGQGYLDADGRSSMPEYHEMSLGQLIDLVAYLTSLRAPGAHRHHGESSHTEQPAAGHSHDPHDHGLQHRAQ